MADQSCLRCGHTAHTVVAQGTDRLYRTTADTFRAVRCIRCGMMRLSPRPADALLPRFYPPEYWFDPDESQAARWAERYRRLVLRDHVRFVARAAAACGTATVPILDVGCGGGLLDGMLRQRGLGVIGLDTSSAACRIAWHRHRVPTLKGDLTRAPFLPASFSLVSMFHVLEHVPSPSAFLIAAGELLRAEGRLVVQVPNAACWQFRWLRGRWNGLDFPRHLNHFRPADLTALLNRCGFQVVRVKHFSLRDNPAGLATSLAPGLDPMSRRVRGKRTGLLAFAAHFALAAAALPFALVEAVFKHGSTIMVEARKQ